MKESNEKQSEENIAIRGLIKKANEQIVFGK